MMAADSLLRSRIVYALLVAVVIALGLASRTAQSHLPPFVREYAGDTLWALAVFFGLRLLFPKPSVWRRAAFAFGFAVLIELSQLYQAA
jgi:glycopeptide antibiotics resistance protein